MHLPESSPRDCSGMRLAVHDALFDASLASSMMNAHGGRLAELAMPHRDDILGKGGADMAMICCLLRSLVLLKA